MPWTVTRQVQWPSGDPVVEVSEGGLGYTNPDALAGDYPGEFQTFDDPEEAAEAAIQVCELWRKDSQPEAQVAHGATGGMTMPFAACPYEELRRWAKVAKERLATCARCGAVLGKIRYRHLHLPDPEAKLFCSEQCAELAYEEQKKDEEPSYQVCESCLEVAADEGVRFKADQALAMATLGLELPDHLCDGREHSDLHLICECACNRRAPG